MSDKYKLRDGDKAYFFTLTVVGWIDFFARRNHKLLLIDSLAYCQKIKGLLFLDIALCQATCI